MARTTMSEFLNLLKTNNIARPNRFKITFAIPDKLSNPQSSSDSSGNAGADYMKMVGGVTSQLKSLAGTDPSSQIALTCMAVDIPSRQETTSEFSYGNYTRRVAYNRTFSEVNMTFLVTGQYTEKKFFDDWFNSINDETNHAVEFYDNYVSTITVECLDQQDNTVYMFQLVEAFPVSIGSLRMDRTTQNTSMLLDVSFAFFRISYGDERGLSNPQDGNGLPGSIIPGQGSGKNRLFPIPGLDDFSDAVHNAVQTVKGFNDQLQGVLNVAKDVREQVRDAKMQVLDGVKTINGTIKDFKAIAHVPTDVKNEVIGVLTDTRNQLGYLTGDLASFTKYPTK